MVGTAFDYLLRFELHRRAPQAVARQWAAEYAPDTIWHETTLSSGMKVETFKNIFTDDQGRVSDTQGSAGDPDLAKRLAGQASSVLKQARSAVNAYLNNRLPTRTEQADLAAHAIRLAKLDEMPRADFLNATFQEADPEDVEDLIALLAIVPFNALIHDKVLLLNPTFGETSRLMGGADADLITGDMLVDFKTTMRTEMQAGDLDQLLGYFFLARLQQQVDPTFPAINRLALYFSRHGYLWSQDATTWTGHPQFAEIEVWFFEYARQLVGSKSVGIAPRPLQQNRKT